MKHSSLIAFHIALAAAIMLVSVTMGTPTIPVDEDVPILSDVDVGLLDEDSPLIPEIPPSMLMEEEPFKWGSMDSTEREEAAKKASTARVFLLQ